LVYPLPGPVVVVWTRFAPISRSFALVVVTAPLVLTAVLPCAPTDTSSGLTVSRPLYSAMRMSGKAAANAEGHSDSVGSSRRCRNVFGIVDRL